MKKSSVIKPHFEFTNWVAPTFANFEYEFRNEEEELLEYPEVIQELYHTAKVVSLSPEYIADMEKGDGEVPPKEWLIDAQGFQGDANQRDFRFHPIHHKPGQIIDRFRNNEPLYMPIVAFSDKHDRYLAISGRHRLSYALALGIPVRAFCIDSDLFLKAIETAARDIG